VCRNLNALEPDGHQARSSAEDNSGCDAINPSFRRLVEHKVCPCRPGVTPCGCLACADAGALTAMVAFDELLDRWHFGGSPAE
jgi:hypothetical protein